VLYPGGALKEDEYYFTKKKPHATILRPVRPLVSTASERVVGRTSCTHSKAIVEECVERGVGTLVVGDLGGIREDDESSEPRNWGDHGNLDLHGWAFDRFTTLLDYKAEVEGIDVELVSERDTSKSCSACGHTDKNQRVERGLYVCEKCGTVANADVNGAENIRQRYSRVSPRMAVIGITAGWHSQGSPVRP